MRGKSPNLLYSKNSQPRFLRKKKERQEKEKLREEYKKRNAKEKQLDYDFKEWEEDASCIVQVLDNLDVNYGMSSKEIWRERNVERVMAGKEAKESVLVQLLDKASQDKGFTSWDNSPFKEKRAIANDVLDLSAKKDDEYEKKIKDNKRRLKELKALLSF